ncbi:perforin-1-like [Periophthalmus magnuspinnatus]|uniref:perforin-1-like n=1 Tax=Periophthalmus magnuspinnatus TaxID=409849 RepID=UPI00243666CD|nr:perforin-1-like [Periophthalmus magnuspinnatus]
MCCDSGAAVQCLLEFNTRGALQWLPQTGASSLLDRTGLRQAVRDGRSFSKVVSAMTYQDSSDWKVGLNLEDYGGLEVGGTRSDAYNFSSTRAKEDNFTFSIHRSSCRHYRYRVSSTPPLSSEFRKDVSLLPSSYNSFTKAQYRRLISTYGTHYIRQVTTFILPRGVIVNCSLLKHLSTMWHLFSHISC